MELHPQLIVSNIIKNDSSFVYPIYNDVNSYNDLVRVWNNYKKTFMLPYTIKNDFTIREIFKFHRSNFNNHVIMYFSKNMRDALLMTRINNNYYNYTIPALNLKEYDKNIVGIFLEK